MPSLSTPPTRIPKVFYDKSSALAFVRGWQAGKSYAELGKPLKVSAGAVGGWHRVLRAVKDNPKAGRWDRKAAAELLTVLPLRGHPKAEPLSKRQHDDIVSIVKRMGPGGIG